MGGGKEVWKEGVGVSGGGDGAGGSGALAGRLEGDRDAHDKKPVVPTYIKLVIECRLNVWR